MKSFLEAISTVFKKKNDTKSLAFSNENKKIFRVNKLFPFLLFCNFIYLCLVVNLVTSARQS